MNIYVSEFAAMPAGDMPVLNIKLMKRLLVEHKVTFIKLTQEGGYHLQTNKELLNIFIKGINLFYIDKPIELKHNEYMNYSIDELNDITEFDYELNVRRGRKISRQAFLKKAIIFLENLRCAHEEEKIDLFLVWGTGLERRLINAFSKKYKIPIFIFELGYFRPFTITVDSKGVNYENSLPRDKEFYEKLEIDERRFDKYLNKPEIAVEDIETGEKYRLIYEQYLKSKNMKKAPYQKKGVKIYRRSTSNVLEGFKRDGKKYIFVPFQLETDTQMIRHSPCIKSNYELVKYVLKAVDIYNVLKNESLQVVFKNHPLWKINNKTMDVKRIVDLISHYDNANYINHVDTNELIKNAEMVITINSTVGIEALLQFKKVISLGKAFYNIEGIVKHCEDPNLLYKSIIESLEVPLNKTLVKKFLYYLRFDYFIECYFPNASDESIERIYKYITKNI